MIIQGQDMSNFSMLDLFRMELETQRENFNENLLALKNNPNHPKALADLMRAAHSIKGAARIVQLDVAVTIAAVMEECFVAAKAGTIQLDPADIELLFAGVDLIARISQVKEPEMKHWLAENQAEISQKQQAIASILTAKSSVSTPDLPSSPESEIGDRPPVCPPVCPPVSPPDQWRADVPDESEPSHRVVPVMGENLHRLMGLAGESLVAANWLEPFADSFQTLKKQQLELSKTLEKLAKALDNTSANHLVTMYLDLAQHQEKQCRQILSDRLSELENFFPRFTNLFDRLYQEVVRATQMQPFSEVSMDFPQLIADLAKKLGKQVKLEIIGQSTPVERDILAKLATPLTHLLQNAILHGIELPDERVAIGKLPQGLIRLEVSQRGGMLSITVTDDGRGIDLEQIREIILQKNLVQPEMAYQLNEHDLIEFLFLPGFSTVTAPNEIYGRGFGLDLAKSMVQEVGGVIRAFSRPGNGMTFHLQLPLSLGLVRTLLVEISGEVYAFPLTHINEVIKLDISQIFTEQNRQYFSWHQEKVSLVSAKQLLELPEVNRQQDALSVVMIGDRLHAYGVVVDRFIGDRDLVLKPLDPRLGKVPDIIGAGFREDGSPVLILDVEDMIRSIERLLVTGQLKLIRENSALSPENPVKKILVVDDSITVRQMERKLLEKHGYKVELAVDGMEAWNAVRTADYDLVITDFDMPKMNGIELTEKIRNHPQLKLLPIIIMSEKNQKQDQAKGFEAGANYYLSKSSFQDQTLLQAVIDTIGKATG